MRSRHVDFLHVVKDRSLLRSERVVYHKAQNAGGLGVIKEEQRRTIYGIQFKEIAEERLFFFAFSEAA
jgi:hypothetical protein